MEKHTRMEIKVLRSDNGGKYTSDLFLQLCCDEGISRYFTVREIPQQNGVAERMNRTLLEKVRCMLSNSRLSKSFWAEALMYVCHLINRLSSSAIGGKTPMKVWSGEATQDYDSLRIFRCPVYYHVKEDKLDFRTKKGVFGVQKRLKTIRYGTRKTRRLF